MWSGVGFEFWLWCHYNIAKECYVVSLVTTRNLFIPAKECYVVNLVLNRQQKVKKNMFTNSQIKFNTIFVTWVWISGMISLILDLRFLTANSFRGLTNDFFLRSCQLLFRRNFVHFRHIFIFQLFSGSPFSSHFHFFKILPTSFSSQFRSFSSQFHFSSFFLEVQFCPKCSILSLPLPFTAITLHYPALPFITLYYPALPFITL